MAADYLTLIVKKRREMSLFQWLVGLAMPCIWCDVVARTHEIDNWMFAREGQRGTDTTTLRVPMEIDVAGKQTLSMMRV